MIRTTSPIRVHVNRKAPVHVHVSTSPSGRKSSSSVRRMKASDWVKASTSKGPWIPPPAKSTTRTKMSWESPTHKLEILPGNNETTHLQYSELGSTNLILEPEESDTHVELDNLKAEVNNLKGEVAHQRTLREMESELRSSRRSLKEAELQIQDARGRETAAEADRSVRRLPSSLSYLKESMSDSSDVNTGRELLLKKLLTAELGIGTIGRQVDLLKESLRFLIRDHSLSPTRAREVVEQSRLLQDQLTDLHIDLKSMKRFLKSQQSNEAKIKDLVEDWEILLHKLHESDATVEILKAQLDDKEHLAKHSHELHDQLGNKTSEVQTLTIRVQSLEDRLQQKDLECAKLQASLHETKKQAVIDKDSLKRATKHHKEKVIRTEQTMESLSQQLEDLKSDLDFEKSQSMKLSRERAHIDIEKQSMASQVRELRGTLDECRKTCKSTVDTYSTNLANKTTEISSLKIDNERLRGLVTGLETQLKMAQTTTESRMSMAHSDTMELKSSLAQYESLVNEYKVQLEKSHAECSELEQELRAKEQEMEQTHHESMIEKEKSKIQSHQRRSELDATADRLKSNEAKLRQYREQLATYERRNEDQTKMITELSSRVEHSAVSLGGAKEKLQEKTAEAHSLSAKVEILEKRLLESDAQNRQLIEISSKKEEILHQLQCKEQKLMEDVAALNRQLDMTMANSRRQNDEQREKSIAKDRANISRVTDLEAQLARCNTQVNHLKKSKEEVERRLNSRVHDLQDQLDQIQATKKSLENYISFLKTSYASIFDDTATATLLK